MMVATRQLN